jgi:hypothetical protein
MPRMKTSVAVVRVPINGCKQLCGKVRTGTDAHNGTYRAKGYRPRAKKFPQRSCHYLRKRPRSLRTSGQLTTRSELLHLSLVRLIDIRSRRSCQLRRRLQTTLCSKQYHPTLNLSKNPALHLRVCLRAYKARKVSEFVPHVLDLEPKRAQSVLASCSDFPIVLTSDVEEGRRWLSGVNAGSRWVGLIASSGGRRRWAAPPQQEIAAPTASGGGTFVSLA